MARSAQQKIKLLYVRELLLTESDEEHPVSMERILDCLRYHGVSAERKSVYDDLETLRQSGMDIELTRAGGTFGYYVASRTFELAELKLLVDSVQCARFITGKKTRQLIKKISSLASCHQADQLQRQVYVTRRVKNINENIYYNVNDLHTAIVFDRRIRFRYFDYTITKHKKLRRDGDLYEVSPFALTWDDGCYYLLAYEADSAMIRHYRVDRMLGLEMLDLPRQGREEFARLDISGYTEQTFSMFGGERCSVCLSFAEKLSGVMIDRFGKDLIFVPMSDGRFSCDVNVVVSPRFFAWIFGFEGDIEIVSPADVRAAMRNQLAAAAALYDN